MKQSLLAGCTAVILLAAPGPAVRAAHQTPIDKAVQRGVAYLRDAELNGTGTNNFQATGVAALAGLTLLECGVEPDDKAVQHAAETVRAAVATEGQTYTLALAVLFLDRLGEPADVHLIQALTVRLMAGQNVDNGGWTYDCPPPPASDASRLNDNAKSDKDGRPLPSSKDLPKDIQDQLNRLNAMTQLQGNTVAGDNSNTQFATVALWVARRHGMPVDTALARIGQRYRNTQNPDGGWAYTPTIVTGPGAASPTPTTATMTCAGLLGLIVAQAAATESAQENGKPAPDLGKDRALKAGLTALATAVGNPIEKGRGGAIPAVGGRTFYYFWSLERVATALDLDAIGGKDWYGWGAEILLANQGADGSWQGEFPVVPDTCFALLFLKRANLVHDLTVSLKGKAPDVGGVTLKGGVGGGEALKSGLEGKKEQPAKAPVESRPPTAAAEETEGARMARELLQAPAERRGQLLESYRDGKGVTYTEALAGAIPQMSGEDKRKARDILAERLTRMKAETLGRYFQDGDAEIRRAAALASAMKESKTLIPDLIPLLADAEPAVAHAAHAALKDLTGEKLGPSVEEWQAWWKKQESK